MQVHYTRLFTDESGASRFEDWTIERKQAFSAPGLETSIFSAPFLASEGSLWVGAPSTWNDEILHQAPRRMIQVTTRRVSNHDERWRHSTLSGGCRAARRGHLGYRPLKQDHKLG